MKQHVLSAALGGLLFATISQGCSDDCDTDVCTQCGTGGGTGGATTSTSGGGGGGGGGGDTGGQGGAPTELPIEELMVYIEINDTDGDSGLHLKLDAKGWEHVDMYGPDDELIFHVQGDGGIAATGLTELFFESAEPGYDVLPLADFLERFPAGTYRFEGMTTTGEKLVGETELSHALPDAPVAVAPLANAVTDASNTVIQWQAVADPPGGQIVGYQVIVVDTETDPERNLEATLPATATSLTVPAEFMLTDHSFKVEVLAIDVSGNQTLIEVPFTTAP